MDDEQMTLLLPMSSHFWTVFFLLCLCNVLICMGLTWYLGLIWIKIDTRNQNQIIGL